MAKVPALQISIAGANLPPSIMRDVLSVSVNDQLSMTSTFTLRLNNWDNLTRTFPYSDSKQFAIGQGVEIFPGYQGEAMNSVIYGNITALELDYTDPTAPALVVTGQDVRHQLALKANSNDYGGLDSDTASAVLNGTPNVGKQVMPTTVSFVETLQRNETDLAFLNRLAWRNNYDLTVKRQTVRFASPSIFGPPVTMVMNTDLSSFTASTSTGQLTNKVELKGYNIQRKPFTGSSTILTKLPGVMSAIDKVNINPTTMTDMVAATVDQARAMANARLNDLVSEYLTGNGTCYFGNNTLRAGATINVTGLGTRFSGSYRLQTVTHQFAYLTGYSTTFSAKAVVQ